MNYLLEVCAGSLNSAIAAENGKAHRVELCDNLAEGGTTPSPGIISRCVKLLSIPVFVLIRPRAGDFLYSGEEIEVMKEDVLFCKEYGAEGVAIGALKPDGSVDVDLCAELIRIAHPMQVTFHRAFDLTRDPFRAMEDIIDLGINRILTSGQAASAIAGADLISELIKIAAGRIIIMPGAGINENNILDLQKKTKAVEFHASLRSPVKSLMQFHNIRIPMGIISENADTGMETDPERVRDFLKKMYD